MTQAEFNAMLATALTSGLGGGSYVHRYSGEEMDALLALMGYEHGDPDLNAFLREIKEAQAAAEAAAERIEAALEDATVYDKEQIENIVDAAYSDVFGGVA